MNKEAAELAKVIGNPVFEAFDAEGITPKRLAKKLKAELNAKETKVMKIKSLKKGPDDKILEVEEIAYSKPLTAWDIRQKARQDAHKLRGDYPAEKREISGPGGEPIPFKLYDFDPSKFPKSKTEDGNGGE